MIKSYILRVSSALSVSSFFHKLPLCFSSPHVNTVFFKAQNVGGPRRKTTLGACALRTASLGLVCHHYQSVFPFFCLSTWLSVSWGGEIGRSVEQGKQHQYSTYVQKNSNNVTASYFLNYIWISERLLTWFFCLFGIWEVNIKKTY